MKTVMLLALLVASPSAFAAAPEIAGKTVSSGTGNPKYTTSRFVSVLADGTVEIDVNKKGKRTSSKAKLSKASVAKLVECSRAAVKAKKLAASHCVGGPYTGYTLGDNTLSRKTCGEKVTMKVSCATNSIKILDSL